MRVYRGMSPYTCRVYGDPQSRYTRAYTEPRPKKYCKKLWNSLGAIVFWLTKPNFGPLVLKKTLRTECVNHQNCFVYEKAFSDTESSRYARVGESRVTSKSHSRKLTSALFSLRQRPKGDVQITQCNFTLPPAIFEIIRHLEMNSLNKTSINTLWSWYWSGARNDLFWRFLLFYFFTDDYKLVYHSRGVPSCRVTGF